MNVVGQSAGKIKTPSYLHWQSGRKGAELALRLQCWSSAILPKDPSLNNEQEQLIIGNLINFSLHARRAIELYAHDNITITNTNSFPSSQLKEDDVETDFRKAINGVIHSNDLKIGWEVPDVKPLPHGGAIYAGYFIFSTDRYIGKAWLGGIATAYILQFMQHLSSDKGVQEC